MCGRYSLTNTDQLRLRFDVDAADIPIPADPNIAPSQELPVILQVDGERRLELMRWGLIPHWSKGADRERYAMINARAETVASKPSYRAPFRRQRCLVPADGFFEWRKDGGRRVPYFIHLRREPIMALAGLYDTWEDEQGVPHRTFAVITTEANDLVRPIHDRMPVILPRGAEAAWLDRELRDPAALAPLLVPYPPSEMEAYPISPRVNDPRVKDPALLRRAA